jgi:hypothetical protein
MRPGKPLIAWRILSARRIRAIAIVAAQIARFVVASE